MLLFPAPAGPSIVTIKPTFLACQRIWTHRLIERSHLCNRPNKAKVPLTSASEIEIFQLQSISYNTSANLRVQDYLRLHLVILLWGFTAVLGNMIDLSATQVVLYRSVAAAAILALLAKDRAKLTPQIMLALIGNGMILGFHWVMFFLAVKLANVSVCMVGMATISFWTALLEPVLITRCKFQTTNLALGLFVVSAVYLIFHSETEFHLGFGFAIAGALLATIFSIINGMFSGKASESAIVMYEMAGAALFCCLGLVISPLFGIDLASDHWLPTWTELIWLIVLVALCTIYAYLVYVELLRRMSVFTINFANNLEPIYGIGLGALLFGDHQHVGSTFYLGATLIMFAVALQAWLTSHASETQRNDESSPRL